MGSAGLRENFGFTYAELNRIAESLTGDLKVLCTRWKDIHESN